MKSNYEHWCIEYQKRTCCNEIVPYKSAFVNMRDEVVYLKNHIIYHNDASKGEAKKTILRELRQEAHGIVRVPPM